jgi:hypothetical protein
MASYENKNKDPPYTHRTEWVCITAIVGNTENKEVSTAAEKWNVVESSWNVMTHGDAREGKWKGNWQMEWIASTLHTASEHGESSITTADAHTSAASSWLNRCPLWFKWTCLFRRKTKSGFCACAITFQMQSNSKFYFHDNVRKCKCVKLNERVVKGKWEEVKRR